MAKKAAKKQKQEVSPVDIDIESELGSFVPDANQLSSIESIVRQGAALMEQIASAEEFLKQAKGELHLLTTRTLPDAMASAGTSEFKTESGLKVTIKDFISGSLPKEDDARTAALTWLAEVGAGDIIKNKLSIEFEKGEDNLAGDVAGYVDGLGLDYEQKRDVHPQTLQSFARERMKAGEDVPLDMLGLYAGRAAKIDLPKKKGA
jgi:hypothetical protein